MTAGLILKRAPRARPANGAMTTTTCWRTASWSAASSSSVQSPRQIVPWMWASGHNGEMLTYLHTAPEDLRLRGGL
jgi:hypothetical protein